MRVNRLFVWLNASVLALANVSVLFAITNLSYYNIAHVLFSLVLTTLVFLLALDEERWRFPWWGSVFLVIGVILLAFWVEDLDKTACNLMGVNAKGQLPTIYLLLTTQCLLLVKLTGRRLSLDFWIEQSFGGGFMLIGCLVCKDDAAFSLLLLAYIALAVVCVMAQYLQRHQETPAICRTQVVVHPLRTTAAAPPGRLRKGPILFWGLVGVPLVLLLFFCTPRPEFAWGAGDVAPFTEGMDLNATGRVKMKKGPAFTVEVTDGPTPQPKLRPDQRWRGQVFTTYWQGRWIGAWETRVRDWVGLSTGPNVQLPQFAPGSRSFRFQVDTKKSGGLLLAEPALTERQPRLSPVVVHNASYGYYPPFMVRTATFDSGRMSYSNDSYNYTQVVPVGADSDRIPATGVFNSKEAPEDYRVSSGIRVYTTELLRDLAENERYGLTATDLDTNNSHVYDLSPRVSVRGERIALALTEYLHSSRAFGYTLDRPRFDKSIDPIEDFLVNTRQGHCERFAAALVLMLRSQGVPARVVVGYRGCLHSGNGKYVVNQDMLHAWVEARVPPKGAAAVGCAVGCPGADYYINHQSDSDWLSLDPTTPFPPPPPGRTATALPAWLVSILNAIDKWWSGLGQGWHNNILHFDGNSQADLLTWAAENAPYLLVVALIGAVLLYALRFLLQWLGFGTSAEKTAVEPFYQQLLELLAGRRGLEPQPAQTPREFGAAAGQVLQAEPATLGLATIPAWIVELYYRVRFGGRPLRGEEQKEVEERLSDLSVGLK